MNSTGYFIRGAQSDIAGLAVRYANSTGYRFYASCATYADLDGRVFATLDAVEAAARTATEIDQSARTRQFAAA
jgi:hypothetical protein